MWGFWFFRTYCCVCEPQQNLCYEEFYIARYPLEAIPPDVETVVDLTMEFPRSFRTRRASNYFVLPALDVCLAPAEDILNVAREVNELRDGKVFVHCANGHGRSALFVALIMLM